MASRTPAAKASRQTFSELRLGLIVGAVTLLCAAAAWFYTAGQPDLTQRRAPPVWMGLDKVVAQLDDGQHLNVKVDLQLKDEEALEALTPHGDAMKVMLAELGQAITREDLASPEGIQSFGQDIRRHINNYLRRQQVEQRVVSVAFGELLLTP
jgi:flagellar basal body-associated protein FliL